MITPMPSVLTGPRYLTFNEYGAMFEFTEHARQRYQERFPAVKPDKYLRGVDVAKGTILYKIRENCPKHDSVTNEHSEYVYWVFKDRKDKDWKIFVTEVIGVGKYRIITCFVIDYTKLKGYHKNL